MELKDMRVLTILNSGDLVRNYVFDKEATEEQLESKIYPILEELGIHGKENLEYFMEEGYINNDTIEIYLSETYWQVK